MLRSIVFFFLLFSHLHVPAQPGISGTWTGKITQNEGGYRSEYNMELILQVKGDEVIGKSRVYVDDIFVLMEVKGKVFNERFVKFEDVKLLDYEIISGLEWCLKTYQLILKDKGWKLEGFWQGDTSTTSCIPGKVFLRREAKKT